VEKFGKSFFKEVKEVYPEKKDSKNAKREKSGGKAPGHKYGRGRLWRTKIGRKKGDW